LIESRSISDKSPLPEIVSTSYSRRFPGWIQFDEEHRISASVEAKEGPFQPGMNESRRKFERSGHLNQLTKLRPFHKYAA
jgi:hypothetical protein